MIHFTLTYSNFEHKWKQVKLLSILDNKITGSTLLQDVF